MTKIFTPGDRARHVNGKEGVVVRYNAESGTVSVQYPDKSRVSVIHHGFLNVVAEGKPLSTPVATVTDKDRGVFRLITASGSIYTLEITGEHILLARAPAETSPSLDFDAESLRRDHETVVVMRMLDIAVGQRGVFFLQPLSDNGADTTIRSTTPITSIELLTFTKGGLR